MNETGNRQKEKPLMAATKTIMQGADGEVKPDPPIGIYPSKLHGYWMVRWRLHDYALSEWPLTADGTTVAAWIERETGEKVVVNE